MVSRVRWMESVIALAKVEVEVEVVLRWGWGCLEWGSLFMFVPFWFDPLDARKGLARGGPQ